MRALLVLLACVLVAGRPGTAAGEPPAVWRWLGGLFAHEGGDERCELGQAVEGGHPEPAALETVVPVQKRAWENALGGVAAARPRVRARLVGLPTRRPVEPLPADDDAFLRRLARDTWRGLDALTDREHALPVDHVRVGRTRAEAQVGDYTNVTSIGLHLVAIVAAFELELIDAPAAVARLRAVLATLGRLETRAGFFFNYYDTSSLERTSNLLSFVDSSWLTAGLMVVRSTFPELHADCTRLIAQGDYRLFYDPTLGRMSHGYWVQRGAPSRYHYGVLYAESRLGSLIAIGKGDVPEAHWFRPVRTFPPSCAWQTGTPQGRRRKRVAGHAVLGGWYEWRGTRYVPSWGGSMFEALMPTLVLDEMRWAPRSLGANDAAHVLVQRRFAEEELGYPVWGLSPSSTPDGADYREYGVRILGSLGYGDGAVTPHAAALALAVAPAAAIADLRALVARYDLYGEYGLYDAVDPRSGAVAPVYLTLDQSMTLIALANHLKAGCIQQRFASDPIAQRALPLLAGEDFFD